MTEEEQISKAAVELVAEFVRVRGGAGGARGGAGGERRCILCNTTSKQEVVRSFYKYKRQKVTVYLCFDGCGIEFFQRLTLKLSEKFGRRVMVVKSF